MLTIATHLKFISTSCRIDIPVDIVDALVENATTGAVEEWLEHVVYQLYHECGVIFSIGKLRRSCEDSRKIAHAIAHRVCDECKRIGAPREMKVEVDKPQATYIPEGYEIRNLLPHHDGGHCTYLTPSLLDVPSWNPELRVFSHTTYYTTHTHKLYQGIFIIEPGEALSVTPYYNWVQMIQDAYEYQSDKNSQSIVEVATWLGENIRRSLAHQSEHKSKYLSVGAALGSDKLVHQGIAAHWGEADFSEEEYQRFPELRELTDTCPCDTCIGRASRLFCLQFHETLGLSWPEVRQTYEVCLPSERYDFIIGNNVSWLHGGLMGGRSRYFEPICFVIDGLPKGHPYEKWLADMWRSAGRFQRV